MIAEGPDLMPEGLDNEVDIPPQGESEMEWTIFPFPYFTTYYISSFP